MDYMQYDCGTELIMDTETGRSKGYGFITVGKIMHIYRFSNMKWID